MIFRQKNWQHQDFYKEKQKNLYWVNIAPNAGSYQSLQQPIKQYVRTARPVTNKNSKALNQPYKQSPWAQKSFLAYAYLRFKKNIIKKEVLFSMNKMSIVLMVTGLMFLGALFFISGFLLALNLYDLNRIQTLQAASQTNNKLVRNYNAKTENQLISHRPSYGQNQYIAKRYKNVGGVDMIKANHRPQISPNINNNQRILYSKQTNNRALERKHNTRNPPIRRAQRYYEMGDYNY